jgi:hypothetical protein
MPKFSFTATNRTQRYTGHVEAANAPEAAVQVDDHMKANNIGDADAVYIDGTAYIPPLTRKTLGCG